MTTRRCFGLERERFGGIVESLGEKAELVTKIFDTGVLNRERARRGPTRIGRIDRADCVRAVSRRFTTFVGALAEIPRYALRCGLLAVLAAIRAPVLRSATADRELALLLILHADNLPA
jgi:hypothetical protein